jgi:hypothetical protein
MDNKNNYIQKLNDDFRQNCSSQEITESVGISSLPKNLRSRIIAAVKAYTHFLDPKGDNDFGLMTEDNTDVFWEIIHFDIRNGQASHAPHTPGATCQILNLMLLEEYEQYAIIVDANSSDPNYRPSDICMFACISNYETFSRRLRRLNDKVFRVYELFGKDLDAICHKVDVDQYSDVYIAQSFGGWEANEHGLKLFYNPCQTEDDIDMMSKLFSIEKGFGSIKFVLPEFAEREDFEEAKDCEKIFDAILSGAERRCMKYDPEQVTLHDGGPYVCVASIASSAFTGEDEPSDEDYFTLIRSVLDVNNLFAFDPISLHSIDFNCRDDCSDSRKIVFLYDRSLVDIEFIRAQLAVRYKDKNDAVCRALCYANFAEERPNSIWSSELVGNWTIPNGSENLAEKPQKIRYYCSINDNAIGEHLVWMRQSEIAYNEFNFEYQTKGVKWGFASETVKTIFLIKFGGRLPKLSMFNSELCENGYRLT